jgi:hypothetical protein
VNCAIIFFTSNALDSILIKYTGETNVYKFMMIVMIEHIIIAFKFGLTAIINDKPSWVKEEENDQQRRSEAINVMLELKKEEYKARGEVVLEDIISRIKTKNKKRAALHLA